MPASKHHNRKLSLESFESLRLCGRAEGLAEPLLQSIETNEGPLCNEWVVQREATEPQPSTSKGIQEPACKKPKMGDEEQPPTDTWNDRVSDEQDMSKTQTADEGEPSEDFDCLNTTEEPSVYLENVQA
ncbi:hypothetical protein E2320_014422 [Naja naja]|nr:hypothetical protein E2320_014422 [Naja naja]